MPQYSVVHLSRSNFDFQVLFSEVLGAEGLWVRNTLHKAVGAIENDSSDGAG